MFGYWVTLFFMEWVVFRGFNLPGGYILRVWAFADLFGDGAWRSLEWLANYEWLAMAIDYVLEGLIAFTAIVALSILVSRGILKYFAGSVMICIFLLIWMLVVIAEGVVNGVRAIKEVVRG